MSVRTSDRSRLIVELPTHVQMAIRLRAVKTNTTTGQVVAHLAESSLLEDITEAKAVIAQRAKEAAPARRQK